MTAPNMLRAALAYAALGWRVLPCQAGGKLPILRDWPNAASTDPDVITEWWRQQPNANIATATEAASASAERKLGMAAAAQIKQLREISEKYADQPNIVKAAADAEGVPFSVDSQGGMFGFFLMDSLPQNYAKVMTTDNATFNKLFHGLLDRGIYIAPALYEAGFVSGAHTEQDIATTIAAAREVFKSL